MTYIESLPNGTRDDMAELLEAETPWDAARIMAGWPNAREIRRD